MLNHRQYLTVCVILIFSLAFYGVWVSHYPIVSQADNHAAHGGGWVTTLIGAVSALAGVCLSQFLIGHREKDKDRKQLMQKNFDEVKTHALQFVSEAISIIEAMSGITFQATKGNVSQYIATYRKDIEIMRTKISFEQIALDLLAPELGKISSKHYKRIINLLDRVDDCIVKKNPPESPDRLEKIYIDSKALIDPLKTELSDWLQFAQVLQ